MHPCVSYPLRVGWQYYCKQYVINLYVVLLMIATTYTFPTAEMMCTIYIVYLSYIYVMKKHIKYPNLIYAMYFGIFGYCLHEVFVNLQYLVCHCVFCFADQTSTSMGIVWCTERVYSRHPYTGKGVYIFQNVKWWVFVQFGYDGARKLW